MLARRHGLPTVRQGRDYDPVFVGIHLEKVSSFDGAVLRHTSHSLTYGKPFGGLKGGTASVLAVVTCPSEFCRYCAILTGINNSQLTKCSLLAL